MAVDYNEKQYLDKEGLKKVFEIIKDSDKKVNSLTNEEIDALWGEVTEIKLPDNEIWYKTTDNEPVELTTTDGFGVNFISNEYDETDGYCKIKFDGEVTTIPGTSLEDGFMTQSTTLTEISHLPSTIESIGDQFLTYCTGLTSVNLSGLRNVTSIGNDFLSECSGLQTLELSPLSKVTSIGDYFLSSCSGLTSLDLSPLTGVTSIENYFLWKCSDIQTINLSGLSNVESIGNAFLTYCSGIQTINLSPLSKVTSIGYGFLLQCTSLKTFIIDHPEGVITLPLEKSDTTPDEIYVNDGLLSQYQEAVSKWSHKFKPLSEYQI